MEFAQFLIATIWVLLVIPVVLHAKHSNRSGLGWGLLALTLSPLVAFICLEVIGRRIFVPPPREDVQSVPDHPDYVFTLVHGTFAPDALWISPDSWFSRTLKAKLQAAIKVIPFVWDGKNRARSRTQAAQRLAEHFSVVARQYPHSRHYLVAHSHGGNIAMEALDYCSNSVWPTGVTTLSTPYIQLVPTPPQVLDQLWLFAVAVYSAIVSLIFVAALFGLLRQGLGTLPREGAIPVTVVVVVTLLFWLSVIVIMKRGLWGTPSRPEPLRLKAPPHVNLLIIRSSGDEASAGLATSQILAWLTKRLMHSCMKAALLIMGGFSLRAEQKIDEKLATRLGAVMGFVFVSACQTAFQTWRGEFSLTAAGTESVLGETLYSLLSSLGIIGSAVLSYVNLIEGLLFPYGFWLGMILTGISVGFGLLALGLAGLTTVVLVPFGGWRPLLTFRASVSVESTPHGKWLLHHLPVKTGADQRALAHSFSYDDERVVDLIAQWTQSESVQADAAMS